MSFYGDLMYFVVFEEGTSTIYPWAMSSEEILKRHEEIEKECKGNSDTEILYDAIDKICGVNTELTHRN